MSAPRSSNSCEHWDTQIDPRKRRITNGPPSDYVFLLVGGSFKQPSMELIADPDAARSGRFPVTACPAETFVIRLDANNSLVDVTCMGKGAAAE